ncbi:MAG TPA: hypothetical protein VHB70_18225 [Parafilimonas sp.]|nr:hypothetical protein [Parafilimonas sp.]
MIKIYLDTNFPKNLITALQSIHSIQNPQEFDIIRAQHISDSESPVIFLFDKGKKGLDIVTEKHFEAGFRVFAFKLYSEAKLDLFKLSLTVLNLWPTALEQIKKNSDPFVFTFKNSLRSLKKVK